MGQELLDFNYLARCGRFREAHDLFENALKPHKHIFAVAAEYVDCLLQQSNYDRLSEFLSESDHQQEETLAHWSEETWIFTLAHAICNLHRFDLLLADTLQLARRWYRHAPTDFEAFTPTKVSQTPKLSDSNSSENQARYTAWSFTSE